MHYNELVPAQASALVPHADRLRLAVAAYLARLTGTSLEHTDSERQPGTRRDHRCLVGQSLTTGHVTCRPICR